MISRAKSIKAAQSTARSQTGAAEKPINAANAQKVPDFPHYISNRDFLGAVTVLEVRFK